MLNEAFLVLDFGLPTMSLRDPVNRARAEAFTEDYRAYVTSD